MTDLPVFTGRTAILASMHRKEQVIAPLVEAQLGVKLKVLTDFDTDQFGTFSRDRPRPGNQLETARAKVQAALVQTGETLAIASEGSFGPHPGLPWLPCNRDLVLLVDQQLHIEIVGEALSTQTNYRQQSVTSFDQALEFATQVGFPDHGLVVISHPQQPAQGKIWKGIVTADALAEAVELACKAVGSAHLETDMRALYNPTRMNVIAEATQNLLDTLAHCCPNCGWPGFAIQSVRSGLPCQLCQLPTQQTLAVIYQCQHCHYEQQAPNPEGLTAADPTYCDYCNP
jgi:hypothetical protein